MQETPRSAIHAMSFNIHLTPDGETFTAKSGETVLGAAQRAGIVLPHSCRDGRCGRCKALVLAGRVEAGVIDTDVVSPAEQRQGFTLLCRAVPLSDLEITARPVAALAGFPVRRLPARVAHLERLAPNVMGLWLKLPGGDPFRFLAGQHVDILLRDGRRRSYSIANAPHDSEFLELHIRHVPGGAFSEHVFDGMKERDLLRIEGPLGTFLLDEASSRPAILLAAGTGFAPFKSMIESALHAGVSRRLHLYRGARTFADLYDHERVLGWLERYPALRYTPVLSAPRPEDGWTGRVGHVQDAVLADHGRLDVTSVYACGPPALIDNARAAFSPRGLPSEHFHADAFEPARA